MEKTVFDASTQDACLLLYYPRVIGGYRGYIKVNIY